MDIREQQRLNTSFSMASNVSPQFIYAFLAPDVPLPNRSNRFFYFVHIDKFMADEYDEAFGYEWLTRRWDKVLKNKRTSSRRTYSPFQ
jgi:hypothetical protein